MHYIPGGCHLLIIITPTLNFDKLWTLSVVNIPLNFGRDLSEKQLGANNKYIQIIYMYVSIIVYVSFNIIIMDHC